MLKTIIRKEEISPKYVKNLLYFDIETMGLNSRYDKVRMITLLYFEDNEVISEQIFATDKKSELMLLVSLIQKIEKNYLLIHYNGNSFDIPFLNNRFKANKLHYKINSKNTVDLYQIIKNRIDKESLKLKDIEKYYNIYRAKDDVDGFEWIELLKKYDRSKKTSTKKLFLHNYFDVINLPIIVQKANLIDFIRTKTILINGETHFIQDIVKGHNIARVVTNKTKIDIPTFSFKSLVFFNSNLYGIDFDLLSDDKKKKQLIFSQKNKCFHNIKDIINIILDGGGTQI